MIGASKPAPYFCALCTIDIASSTPKRAPIGKDDALVCVCDGCYTEMATEDNGPDRSYEPSGGTLTREMITAAMKRKMGEAEYQKQMDLDDEFARAPSSDRKSDADAAFSDHVYETRRRGLTGASKIKYRRTR